MECTEKTDGIKRGRIGRDRVMLYSEFPTIFKNILEEDKEVALFGVENSALISLPSPLEAIADPFKAD